MTLACALLASCLAAQESAPSALPREPRRFRAGAVTYEADVGLVPVPLDHARDDGPRIQLAVARLKSTASEPGAPIVFLAGGPGEGATNMADSPIWAAYLELGDVLLVDQRGTGRSQPSLAEHAPELDAGKLFLDRPTALAAVLEASRAAAADLRASGIDLAFYDARQSADDVVTVVHALGYERARLLAHSYGTHVALDLLRRHAELVERCALLGAAGPDDLLKPASELDPFVGQLAQRAKAAPELAGGMPDLVAVLARVLARAAKEPFMVELPGPGEPVRVAVGRFGLERVLLADLGDPSDLVVFPRLLAELDRGETALLAWFVAKRFEQSRRLPLALYALRGPSGASPERAAHIAADAKQCLFEDARNFPFPDVLSVLGIRDLGEAFRRPVTSDVPALVVSGTLDANTPVRQGQIVRRGFAHGAHLVVANAGHDDLLFDERIRERVVAFLAGDEAHDGTLEIAPRPFVPLTGTVDPAAHPALGVR